MVAELHFQQFTIRKFKLELLAVEHRIVLVDDAMVVGADDPRVHHVGNRQIVQNVP